MANSASKTCLGSLSVVIKEKPVGSRTLCDPPAMETCDCQEPRSITRESMLPKDLKRKGDGSDADRVPSAEEESSEEERFKCRITKHQILPECSIGRKLIEHACDDADWLSELMEMEIPFESTYMLDSFREMDVSDDFSPGTTEKETAEVRPHLKKIILFRDLLNQNKFEQAEEFLEQFLKDENPRTYRRDVLRSLSRCFQRIALRKTHPEYSQILHRLDMKLSEELRKEDLKVETIEEAFQERSWIAMNALFEANKKSLSKIELRKVILLAVENKEWQVFGECVDLGADLVCPGEKLVFTHTVEEVNPFTIQMKAMENKGKTRHKSPLHEALKTGEFRLEKVEHYFQKNAEFSNATDHARDSLLHLAVRHGHPETRKANVKLLLQYNADVNILDIHDKTPMQYLQHPRYKPWEVELLMMLVTESKVIHSNTWRAGVDEWTPLHMLCSSGRYQDLHVLIKKGDNPRALRRGLTLIDTVVLQDSLHWELKPKVLDTLLKDPIQLGPFHRQVVERRATEEEIERKYVSLLLCGKDYLYPTDRLLFPLVSTCTVRAAYKEMVVMLLEGGALCESELARLYLSLDSMDDDPDFVRRMRAFLYRSLPC